MLKEGIFELGDFMKAFAKTPSFMRIIDRAKVKIEKTFGAKVLTCSTLWGGIGVNKIANLVKDEDGEDQLITLKVLDLPEIHHYTKNKDDDYIYKQLANCKDDDIFSSISIKAMIE